MQASTPKPKKRVYWYCAALILINLAVFAAMVSVNPLDGESSFPTSMVVNWGASYGPDTLSGQPWRLIASAFIHYNYGHVIYNMVALALLGCEVERRYGGPRFLLIYVYAALVGSCLSLLLSPVGAGAGASGACYGMAGALIAYLLVRKGGFRPFPLAWYGVIGLIYLSQSFYFATVGGAGSANHLGGLIAGFFTGCTFYQAPKSIALAQGQTLGRAFMAASVLALFISVTYAPLDFRSNYKLARAIHQVEEGNLEEARRQIVAYNESQPASPLGYAQMAGLEHGLKRDREARALYLKAMALGYKTADVWVDYAEVCYELGLYRESIEAINKSLEKSSDLRNLLSAVHAYVQLGEEEQAAEVVARMQKDDGARRTGRVAEAELLRWSGQLDQALNVVQPLYRERPGDFRVADLLASLLAESGREIDAREIIAQFEEKHPGKHPYNFDAMFYLSLGDWRAASVYSDRILNDRACLQDGSASYGAIYKLIALRALKDLKGETDLAINLDRDLKERCWPYPLFAYLTGRLPLRRFLAAVDTRGKETEFDAFEGMCMLVGGKEQAGIARLEKVRSSGLRAYMERDMAAIVLARRKR